MTALVSYQVMTHLKCQACGADLLPGAGFCRQCGIATSNSGNIESSEQPTAIFPKTDAGTTQRLEPRPTSPTRPTQKSASRKNIFLMVMVIVLLLGIIATMAVLSDHSGSTQGVPSYPGATTVVDMNHPDGGRTLHLQTSDPLDRVERWYQNNLKVDKTVRLTSNSVVMKNQKASITLAVENNKTQILIKQAP